MGKPTEFGGRRRRAIYALRKELFEPLSPEDINDFVLPLRVIAKGYQGVFEPEAICYEDAAPSFKENFDGNIE